MPVKDVCVRNVVHVNRDTTIHDAAQLMRQHHVGDLIVAENGFDSIRPIGIVTDRDIVLSVVAPRLEATVITAGDVMGPELVTCPEEMGVTECIHRMRQHGVRRMPIVSASGDLVGIVSVDDLIEVLSEELTEIAKLIAREQGREVRLRR
ncbi:MAG: CBS domain-containing protein [Acidobacteria bacterium]|nr:CBS domain-containing protein [Acidobacteriota bacterium]